MPFKRCFSSFILFLFIHCVSASSQPAVEERLDRIEAKLDTLLSYDRGQTDSVGPGAVIRDDLNLMWGILSDSGTILDKEYFVINHNNDWKIPYWVAYYLSSSNLQGDVSRTEDFRPDPQLPRGSRSELADYRHSGYDRGHNAPAAAFKRSRAAMSATFLLSNMSPQTPRLNRHIWKALEEQVRETVMAEGEGWVVTGNLFLDLDSNLVNPADSIGENNLAIPTHCFKVVLIRDADDTCYMYAFLLPNQIEHIPGEPADYILTVDRLEEISGYDFFPILENHLEDSLEGLAQSVWPR